MNFSGLNEKVFTQRAGDNQALFGGPTYPTLGDLISRQFGLRSRSSKVPIPQSA